MSIADPNKTILTGENPFDGSDPTETSAAPGVTFACPSQVGGPADRMPR